MTVVAVYCVGCWQRGSVHEELVILRKASQHMPQSRILTLMISLCEGVKVLHTATPCLAHRYCFLSLRLPDCFCCTSSKCPTCTLKSTLSVLHTDFPVLLSVRCRNENNYTDAKAGKKLHRTVLSADMVYKLCIWICNQVKWPFNNIITLWKVI